MAQAKVIRHLSPRKGDAAVGRGVSGTRHGGLYVNAIASVVGLFGVTQEVTSQRVQADRNGSFSFSFTPQLPLPGTRYARPSANN